MENPRIITIRILVWKKSRSAKCEMPINETAEEMAEVNEPEAEIAEAVTKEEKENENGEDN